ncbi:MAG: rubredoxin, partial [Candidatus Riflebacteria bacterium]|nr:rubredoxin [Candidatus Riflebacteria bacterium]
VYEPEKGDQSNNIPGDICFHDLLDSWECPWCYASKSNFKEFSEEK